MVPSLRTKLGALAALFHLSNIYVASGQLCGCSSLVIPVHVDVLIPKDPADPFGGLKSNASSLRRLNETYDVFGVFCQPNTAVSPEKADVVQLLVHGFSYTSQYWSPPTEEFRNYSYTEFACDRGLSSLAIDLVGVGLSSRPANASDVQFATNAAVVSQLARHLKTASIIAGVQPFKKVIAIGHSAGTAMLTLGATAEGARSPFDGFILTGNLNVQPGTLPPLPGIIGARDDTPLRWGGLDSNYITTNNRSLFYPANPNSFSPRMVIFDAFTKDVGPLSTQLQGSVTSLPAHYPGPVAKVVGSEDQGFCAAGNCVDVVALNAAERLLWPDARSFDVVVAQGSGHDLNLDFFAKGPFNTFVHFVEQFAAL
ncbi:Alpha/beta hydrolase family-domain-containing protein [Mycena vulgaris]|nr:Alpha/beta hydrolase family-domain-containing protein [Mycena vulgaris]KAJ6584000.1 Alpha/beta hydrolase family-domain-containing protein [Mycena vulgaris]